MEVIDVSMEIDEDMPIYPDNPRPEIERYRQIPEDSTTESEIAIGSHTGTHVDAPMHVEENGKPATGLDLEDFYGDCQVLDLTDCVEGVGRSDLEDEAIDADIVLLKTDNSNHGYSEFREDFTYVTLGAVEHLIDEGVSTAGIDYLSLVEFDGGESAAEAHRKANADMNVVEGLDLRSVEPGSYVFSGMPLRIAADGAPMRAVLIRDPSP